MYIYTNIYIHEYMYVNIYIYPESSLEHRETDHQPSTLNPQPSALNPQLLTASAATGEWLKGEILHLLQGLTRSTNRSWQT